MVGAQSIDWAATGAMLAGIGTIVGACAVVFAALVGRDTFKGWRRQKQEERRMAAAEQLLVLAYKLNRAFGAIRSPGMLSAEISEMERVLRENNLLTDETNAGSRGLLTTAQATLSRAARHNPDFEELLNITPVAKALFGEEIEIALGQFWIQRGQVTIAAQRYADLALQREPQSDARIESALERRFALEAIIWEGGGEDGVDQVANALDKAITTLEQHLLPIIRNA